MGLDVQVWSFGGVSIIMDVSTQLIRAQVSKENLQGTPACRHACA